MGLILIALIFIPYLLGNSIGDNRAGVCDSGCDFAEICNPNAECDNIDAWFEGLFYLVFGGIVLTIIIIIIYKWLSSNWEKAEYKARLEFHSQKRRKAK